MRVTGDEALGLLLLELLHLVLEELGAREQDLLELGSAVVEVLELRVAEHELVELVPVEVGVGLEQLAHVALLVEGGLELLVRVEHQSKVGRAPDADELLGVLLEDLEHLRPG